jgi:putative zinc finger protein
MQHLDEGTIHSWLDGALSADEAARVEAHVKECPQCAAAVAEARGFIAASSRILTALDNAPRGVVPVAAPKRRVDPIVWRVAATLLVVAGGTLVVFRSGGREAQIATSADTTPSTINAVVPMARIGDQTIRSTAEPTPPPQANAHRKTAISSLQPSAGSAEKGTAKQGAADTLAPAPQTLPALAPRVSYSPEARAPAAQTNIPARENQKVTAPVNGGVTGNISLSSGSAGGAAPIPQTLSPLRLRGATALDETRAQFSLKEVGHPRTLGVKVTLYEVAPGDTVTFTEPVSLQLNAVVVTGVGTEERVARQSAGKAAAAPVKRSAADAAAASAPESARAAPTVGATAPAPSAPVPATLVEVANGVTTISWPDPTTGSVLTLSGRMPEARLQQIRIRIERERATAAAKKKP